MILAEQIHNLFNKYLLYLGKNRFFDLIFLILCVILGDVMFFQKSSDLRTFPILIFYLYIVRRFRITSQTTFLLCIILLFVMYLHYIFSPLKTYDNQYPLAPMGERVAVWLYLFFIIGVFQKWKE